MNTCFSCGAPLPAGDGACRDCAAVPAVSSEGSSPVWRRPRDPALREPDLPATPVSAQSSASPPIPAAPLHHGTVPTGSGTVAQTSPGSPPDPAPGRSGTRWAVIGIVAALVAIVLGMGLHQWAGRGLSAGFGAAAPTFPVDPRTPTARSDASSGGLVTEDGHSPSTAYARAAQAAAVDELLDRSAAGRGLIGPAVLALGNCDLSVDPASAVSSIEQAVRNRTDLLAGLEPLEVGDLPGGSELKDLLRQAWTQSLEADRQYLSWAESIAAGGTCDPQAPAKRAGDAASGSATRAKAAFAEEWNALVAGPLGLTLREERNL
jgi:hypothetical protein